MALAEVQDILASWPGWATLDLSDGDETSGQGSGQIRVRELRDAYWVLSATSRTLSPNQIRYWKAKLAGLGNGKKLFYGYDLTNKYPAEYPNAAWPTGVSFDGTTATIGTLGGDGVSLTLEDLPATFVLGIGDMLSFTYGDGDPEALSLHQLVESATASGAGATAAFEVRPPLPFGAEEGATVRVKTPRCHMMIMPGSISTPKDVSGWGEISFQAVQVRTP